MIIQYLPEDGEMQTFDVRLRASEIQVVERTADGRWADIKEALSDGDMTAMRTVAWVIKKRGEPSLRYGDFDPWEGELRARLDAAETRRYAQSIFEKYGHNPEELAEAFAELRGATGDREACEQAIADVTAPKDPAPAEPEPQTESSVSLSVA